MKWCPQPSSRLSSNHLYLGNQVPTCRRSNHCPILARQFFGNYYRGTPNSIPATLTMWIAKLPSLVCVHQVCYILCFSSHADHFPWAMIFYVMLDSLNVPSFWHLIFYLCVCLFFSDASFIALPLIYAFLYRWPSIIVGFMFFCDMLFFWPYLGLRRYHLRPIVAWLNRFWRLFMIWRHSQDADFGLSFFVCSFSFLQMQCYCIRFAFEDVCYGVLVLL
jgi:hypothetical protein